jgi:hypothetical protein
MRVRNNVLALVLTAAAVLSAAGPARAQGPSPRPLPQTPPAAMGEALRAPAPPAALAIAPPSPDGRQVPGAILPGVEHLYTPPVVLGEAWARALRTVLDDMKHLVDTQKLADEPLRPEAPVLTAARPIRSIPAWRARWTPAGALREALAASPVQTGPVVGVPPLETGVDSHGQNVVLLGARVALPWMVP